jgi:hypothetical protein
MLVQYNRIMVKRESKFMYQVHEHTQQLLLSMLWLHRLER